MARPQDRLDIHATALAWLWSRSPSPTAAAGEPVDLETLDQWRQGLLSADRSAQVKRQVADDPRLMRMLEDLVAADELVEQWTAEEKRHASGPGLWSRLGRIARDLLSRLREPFWAGGLIVAAASTVFVAILVPIAQGPSLERQLDGLYASLEVTGDHDVLPWGPRIALRGSSRPPIGVDPPTPEALSKQAFQVGVVKGIKDLSGRYPAIDADAAEHLPRDLPNCAEGDEMCRRQVELAQATGRWALAAHLQCREAAAAEPLVALPLLPELQTAWTEVSPEHPLGTAMQALPIGETGCAAIRAFLRHWGR